MRFPVLIDGVLQGDVVELKEWRESVTHFDALSVYGGVMRTNIDIDDELLAAAQELAGTNTKRATVQYALEELVRRRTRQKILDLRGRIEWVGDLEQTRRSRTG